MQHSRKEGDSNPRYGNPHVSLANWGFQPLTHPSLMVLLSNSPNHKCSMFLHALHLSECKGTAFFFNRQTFALFFAKKHYYERLSHVCIDKTEWLKVLDTVKSVYLACATKKNGHIVLIAVFHFQHYLTA